MNRADLQNLSALRLKEAKLLLDQKLYEGSCYLAGYAVECALKACFAKQIKEGDFPDRNAINAAYTHNLEALMKASGVEPSFKAALAADKKLEVNWGIVKQWNESYRYEINVPSAQRMYAAITDPDHGVLTWLKNYW